MKGIVELLVRARIRSPSDGPYGANSSARRGVRAVLGGKRLGWLGEIADDIRQSRSARSGDGRRTRPDRPGSLANFWPPYDPIPEYPAIERDLNFVLDEAVSWQELLEETVRTAAGPLLESVAFASQYRGQQIPACKKSYVAQLVSEPTMTLTGEDVNAVQQKVSAACHEKLKATLHSLLRPPSASCC